MGFAVYKTTLGQIELQHNNNAITGITKIKEEKPVDLGERTPLTDNAAAELVEYLEGKRQSFDFPMETHGTPFQEKVWTALREIPYGETRSYKEIATAIGNERACRAVGMANNKNPIAIATPCHRVVGQGGALVGYACGLDMKEFLLRLEHENMGKAEK